MAKKKNRKVDLSSKLNKKELKQLKKEILAKQKKAEHRKLVTSKTMPHKNHLTLGQRAADAIAEIGGSWKFIFALSLAIAAWIVVNTALVIYNKWDPYPFILLNLTLSCLAAFQAPVILMSQNRAAERDRIKAERDYYINRKAEREVQNMQKDLDDIKDMIRKKSRKRK